MPHTVAQLSQYLAGYKRPQDSFIDVINVTLPRIYNMGLWNGCMYETSMSGAAGYVTLPDDADAVLACTIDDMPAPTRAMWHDVRLVGRHPEIPDYFGLIDLGYFPTLTDISSFEQITTLDLISVINEQEDESVLLDDLVDARITVRYEMQDGRIISTDGSFVEFNGVAFIEVINAVRIVSISYDNLPFQIRLIACEPDGNPIDTLALCEASNGVTQYRRFKVPNAREDTMVHLLLKRGFRQLIRDTDIVRLENLNAIKHGLLGSIAEDNADDQRAEYHWSIVARLLDEELDAFRGGAKPTLMLGVWGAGAGGPTGMM